MFGHRGIWSDGWKAVTYHRAYKPFENDVWELYHVDEDFSEARNLAGEHPEKLEELVQLWWSEAEKHGVLPLDDDFSGMAFRERRAGTPHAEKIYRYLPPMSRLPNEAAPAIAGRSWRMEAWIDRSTGDEEGVLVAWGTANTGLSWYVKDAEIVFDYNLFGDHHVLRAALPAGECVVEVDFVRDDEGAAVTVGSRGGDHIEGRVPWVLRFIGMSGMDVGKDAGSAVTDDYVGPFPFQGGFTKLHFEVTEELDGPEIYELDRARVRREMTQQ